MKNLYCSPETYDQKERWDGVTSVNEVQNIEVVWCNLRVCELLSFLFCVFLEMVRSYLYGYEKWQTNLLLFSHVSETPR